MLSGSAGVHTRDSAATLTSSSVMPSPTANATCVRHALLIADPRVEPRVGEVDGEIDDHDARGHEQRDALDDRQVARGDRAEGQAAEAGQGEDGFQDDASRQELTELETGHGHDR